MKSTKWTLQAADFLKGLIVAIMSPVLPIIIQSFSAGTFTLDWKTIGTVAAGAFSAYILHKFGTDDTKVAIKTLSDQNVSIIEHPSPQVN